MNKIVYSAYLCVIILVLLEITVRICGYSEANIYDPIYMPFEKSDSIPYIHKPNLNNVRAPGSIIINTDSLGLRSETAGAKYGPKQSDEYRIAVIGDSVTFGVGVKRTKDIFSQVMEDILNKRQHDVRVKVFNYAAAAYSVKEMASTLQYRMLEVEPDLVIMAIIHDDLDLTRTPSVDKWGYFYNKRTSGNISQDSLTKQLLRKIHSAYFLRDVVLKIIAGKKKLNVAPVTGISESYKYIKKFKSIANDNKLSYAVVLLNARDDEEWKMLSKQLIHDKITYIDTSQIYNELIASKYTKEELKASIFDNHPSAIVHRKIGEKLADIIQKELRVK